MTDSWRGRARLRCWDPYDDRPEIRVMFLYGFRDFLLRNILDPFVDGKLECGSRLRVAVDLEIEHVLTDICGSPHDAGRAFQILVEELLDTTVAFFFVVDTAEDMRGERTFGVVAAAFGSKFQPVEVICAEAFGFFEGELALDPQKTPPGLYCRGQAGTEFPGIEIKDTRKNFGCYSNIGNAKRIHTYGIHGDAHRKRLIIAVEDYAAWRSHFNLMFLLLLCLAGILVVMENLQLEQPGDDDQTPDEAESGK